MGAAARRLNAEALAVISRWNHWRRGGADGREAIAAVGERKSSVSDYTAQQQFWGKVTSRPRISRRDLEYLAWKLGCTVTAVKAAIDQGLFDGRLD
jgi:hypothetical protein